VGANPINVDAIQRSARDVNVEGYQLIGYLPFSSAGQETESTAAAAPFNYNARPNVKEPTPRFSNAEIALEQLHSQRHVPMSDYNRTWRPEQDLNQDDFSVHRGSFYIDDLNPVATSPTQGRIFPP